MFNDESSLFFLKNFKVKKILGDHNNIKITLKNDLNNKKDNFSN